MRRLLRIAPAYLVASFLISGVWFPNLLANPIGIATTWQSPILVVWTLLAAFSIGILLAPAAAFAVLAAAGVGSSSRPEAALVALGAMVLVAAGLALT